VLRISQRHLKILETCPRQFEYTFCDRLTLPIAPTQQSKTQLGSDFHLLIHQRELGLPIEPILARSPQLQMWMQAMLQTAPELFQPNANIWRESEHVRTLAIAQSGGSSNDNYLFTAIYDLLILQPDRADIIDWKTYPLPKYKKDLDLEWQTRLYMYMLAETSDYVPKQINFTYWFIQSTPQPKSVQIGYTLKQHRQTHADLHQLLEKLTNWLDVLETVPAGEKDRTNGEPFPQVESSQGLCQQCNFAVRCKRKDLDLPEEIAFANPDFYQIPIIPI
jgi:hypothetical protein